ncbi:3-(methylthio)propionyl-CoA ligase [Maricurvus nonylphenolicus]|uniref:long-chain fatty acid--CoA ligase n=1 Tax=Maricurvus nonylphenolicus TaxID=1008307 RepID=UPI0036F26DA2
MNGLMMDFPLTITGIMQHANRVHGSKEVVSALREGDGYKVHRCTYGDLFKRAGQLANALQSLGVKQGDVLGTLAWNDYRHMEIYYAVCCSGAVVHTVNPRLFEEQLEYIVNHGEDQWLFIDLDFLPLIEKMQDRFPKIKGYILLCDAGTMPDTSLKNVYAYETLMADQPQSFAWPELDEKTASGICYTSGTTGNPKGVVYSHRSTVLISMTGATAPSIGLTEADVVLPVVPMFHVNAWNLPYTCPMVGAKLVLPGPFMGSGQVLAELMDQEKVTASAGVPTVWLGLLEYLRASDTKLATVNTLMVGGAATPKSLMEAFEKEQGIFMMQGWGMTETSPLGTMNGKSPEMDSLSGDEQYQLRLRVGRPTFGVEVRIVDTEGEELPWDGEAAGALQVRGPWICSEYLGIGKTDAHTADGWFDTGDIATVQPSGNVAITDRVKDVIKSGGEWISSNDLENAAVSHPEVAEAGAIGVYHPKWSERPLLCVVPAPGKSPSKESVLATVAEQVAKWWVPEDVVFVESLPHTATGKISKKDLREQFKDYQFPA